MNQANCILTVSVTKPAQMTPIHRTALDDILTEIAKLTNDFLEEVINLHNLVPKAPLFDLSDQSGNETDPENDAIDPARRRRKRSPSMESVPEFIRDVSLLPIRCLLRVAFPTGHQTDLRDTPHRGSSVRPTRLHHRLLTGQVCQPAVPAVLGQECAVRLLPAPLWRRAIHRPFLAPSRTVPSHQSAHFPVPQVGPRAVGRGHTEQ